MTDGYNQSHESAVLTRAEADLSIAVQFVMEMHDWSHQSDDHMCMRLKCDCCAACDGRVQLVTRECRCDAFQRTELLLQMWKPGGDHGGTPYHEPFSESSVPCIFVRAESETVIVTSDLLLLSN